MPEIHRITLRPVFGINEGQITRFRSANCECCPLAQFCFGMTENGAELMTEKIEEQEIKNARCVTNGLVKVVEDII